jgi:hypothetical protein
LYYEEYFWGWGFFLGYYKIRVSNMNNIGIPMFISLPLLIHKTAIHPIYKSLSSVKLFMLSFDLFWMEVSLSSSDSRIMLDELYKIELD